MEPFLVSDPISTSLFLSDLSAIEERWGPYFYRVLTRGLVMNPKPRDLLKFQVKITTRHFSNFANYVSRVSTLLDTSFSISFESFLQNNPHFLTSFLSCYPQCNPYFIPEILDQISQRIVPMVQRVLEVRTFPSDSESADSECQEIPFDLNILVHLIEEEESEEGNEEMEDELAFIEESMQQSVMMVPASTEAINSLTPLIDPLLLKTENCSICMEKNCGEESDNGNIKLSSTFMPCRHVFHHQCIVKWLQTSHVCPLCRYPMPKAN